MTPQQMQAAVRRWSARYPTATIRELGWGLLDIAKAADAAERQIQQAIDRPDKARELAEAERAFARLRECIGRHNGESAQIRGESWLSAGD